MGKKLIVQRIGANVNFGVFGGHDHHLTLSQHLEKKKLVTLLQNQPVDAEKLYPKLIVPQGLKLNRTVIRLSMFGLWFATACTAK